MQKSWRIHWRHHWPQLVIGLAIVLVLGLALDFRAKQQASHRQQTALQQMEARVSAEIDWGRALRVTLVYVESTDCVEAYARKEANMIRPGEMRVVPLYDPPPAPPTPAPTALPAVLVPRDTWEAWWMLFFNTRPPGR